MEFRQHVDTRAEDDVDAVGDAGRADVVTGDGCMLGVEFDGRDGHGWVFRGEPDGGVAAQGADFEGVFDVEHAALQSEEFAVGRGAVDVGDVVFVADFQGAGERLMVGTGRGVQMGHGVRVNGGPASIDLIFTPRMGVHLGSS